MGTGTGRRARACGGESHPSGSSCPIHTHTLSSSTGVAILQAETSNPTAGLADVSPLGPGALQGSPILGSTGVRMEKMSWRLSCPPLYGPPASSRWKTGPSLMSLCGPPAGAARGAGPLMQPERWPTEPRFAAQAAVGAQPGRGAKALRGEEAAGLGELWAAVISPTSVTTRWHGGQRHGPSCARNMLLNPFRPFTITKILTPKAAMLLLLTLLLDGLV